MTHLQYACTLKHFLPKTIRFYFIVFTFYFFFKIKVLFHKIPGLFETGKKSVYSEDIRTVGFDNDHTG